MVGLDWSQCPVVESVPGKVSVAWVFRGTRMPVATVFENLEEGMTIDELVATYDALTREHVKAWTSPLAAWKLRCPPLNVDPVRPRNTGCDSALLRGAHRQDR